MKESELFQLIYDRLINIHYQDPTAEYMILLKDAIKNAFDREKLFQDYMDYVNSKKQ